MTFDNASFVQHSIAILDAELARLLHPGRFYDHPRDVLADAGLTASEQRAILSSWASDACAVESLPALRHAPFASRAVSFDEIMDALAQLDRQGSSTQQRLRPQSSGKVSYLTEIPE
jgi:hypothetical protein